MKEFIFNDFDLVICYQDYDSIWTIFKRFKPSVVH